MRCYSQVGRCKVNSDIGTGRVPFNSFLTKTGSHSDIGRGRLPRFVATWWLSRNGAPDGGHREVTPPAAIPFPFLPLATGGRAATSLYTHTFLTNCRIVPDICGIDPSPRQYRLAIILLGCPMFGSAMAHLLYLHAAPIKAS